MAVNNENLAKCATCTMLDDIRDADKQYQYATAAMQAGDKELAVLGEIHPVVNENYGFNTRACRYAPQ